MVKYTAIQQSLIMTGINNMENDMTLEKMLEQLRSGTSFVKFKKVNGEDREMYCTLDPEFIPEAYKPKEPSKTNSGGAIRVFDVSIQQWRSFRFDSVITFHK